MCSASLVCIRWGGNEVVIFQVSVGKVGVFVGVFSIPCVYQVGDNEDIPENVRDIFGKKPAIEISTPNDQDLNMSDEVSPVAGDEALKLQKVTPHMGNLS